MESPTQPSVPALARARARHVDLFAALGWPYTHISNGAPLPVKSSHSRRTASSGSSSPSPPTTAYHSSQSSLIKSKRASGGLFDAYDNESLALPDGALIIKASTLDSIKQPEALTRHLDRPPSPQPYTIRSVANTHYLIEKNGLPIWIEKESCSSSTSLGDGEDEKSDPPPPTSRMFTPREFLFVLNVCLAQFFSLAALAQTWAPLLDVARALHITQPGLMAWPTAAYSLTLGSRILPAGRLGDMYGHKKLFLIGWVWFALASVVCGFSDVGGFEMLTGCRALQGIGPALLVPNGLALLARNFPMGVKRNLAISLFGGSGPVGVVFGAFFSSLLGQLASWKWSYWCLAIATALVAGLSYLIVPVDTIPAQPSRPHNEFDFLGAVTGVGGLVLLNFGLNQAPITGWDCPYIGVTLGLGVLMMCAFVYIELKVARHPLIPLKGIKKDAALTLACIAAGWASHGIWYTTCFS